MYRTIQNREILLNNANYKQMLYNVHQIGSSLRRRITMLQTKGLVYQPPVMELAGLFLGPVGL